MNRSHTLSRYPLLTITLHWLTLILLVAVYTLIELRGMYPKGSDARELMKHWHFVLGLLVLALVLIRLPMRALSRTPGIVPTPPVWQEWLAKTMHLALYASLIGMPLLGWAVLSAKGKVVPFFGLELPALIAPDRLRAGSLEGLHKLIGTLGYWLVGLHVMAALYHHYLMRDDTLRRILPGRPRASGSDREGSA